MASDGSFQVLGDYETRVDIPLSYGCRAFGDFNTHKETEDDEFSYGDAANTYGLASGGGAGDAPSATGAIKPPRLAPNHTDSTVPMERGREFVGGLSHAVRRDNSRIVSA